MLFIGMILKSHKICHGITRCLDICDIGQYAALCAGTVAGIQSCPTRLTQYNEETEARTFNSKVVNGNIRASVRVIWEQGQIRVLFPGDSDTKTGRLVMEVMREKHPVMRIPDLTDPECSSFDQYKKYPNVLPLYISE